MRFLKTVFSLVSFINLMKPCLFWEFINQLNFRIWLLSLFPLCWGRVLFVYFLCFDCATFWILMKLRISIVKLNSVG